MKNTTLGKMYKFIFWFCLTLSFILLFTPSAPSWPFFLLLGGFVGYSVCDAQWEKGINEKEDGEVFIQRSRKEDRDVSVGKNDLKKIRERIDLAIMAGEVLSVKYMGGSNPGEKRELVPLAMVDEVVLSAICQKSKRKKSFRIDRIIFDELDEEAA